MEVLNGSDAQTPAPSIECIQKLYQDGDLITDSTMAENNLRNHGHCVFRPGGERSVALNGLCAACRLGFTVRDRFHFDSWSRPETLCQLPTQTSAE